MYDNIFYTLKKDDSISCSFRECVGGALLSIQNHCESWYVTVKVICLDHFFQSFCIAQEFFIVYVSYNIPVSNSSSCRLPSCGGRGDA